MNDGGASDGALPSGGERGGDLLNFKTCSLITKLFEAKRKVFRPAAVQEAKAEVYSHGNVLLSHKLLTTQFT